MVWWKTVLKMLGKWGFHGSSYQPSADKIPRVSCGWEDGPDKASIREPEERRCREKNSKIVITDHYSQVSVPLVFFHSRPMELCWWENMKHYGEDTSKVEKVSVCACFL